MKERRETGKGKTKTNMSAREEKSFCRMRGMTSEAKEKKDNGATELEKGRERM